MALYERTLVISPPRKADVVEYAESDQELVLRAFAAKPNLDFGSVKINTRVETSLKICNPSDVDLTVSVSKAPDQFSAVTKFVVPAHTHVTYSVAWRPKEEGAVRKALNVSATPGHPPIKTGIVLIGKCVDTSKGPEWKRAASKAKPAAGLAKKPPATGGSFRNRLNSASSNASTVSTSSAVAEASKQTVKEVEKQTGNKENANPNLPPKKRGFFRSAQKVAQVKQSDSQPSPAPPVIVNSTVIISEPEPSPVEDNVSPIGSDDTFLVPETPLESKTPTKNNSSDETFLVPTPGPRDTFVVVPQASQATLDEIRCQEKKNMLAEDCEEGEEKKEEKRGEMPPPSNKFRFPGSLYKKRRSSTPVTSPKDRYGGSLRSTTSEVMGHSASSRSPTSRFAGAVSEKLDGVITRSKSLNVLRKSKLEVADVDDGADTREVQEHRTLPATSKPAYGNALGTPNQVFERFQRKMEALKIGAGIKRSAKKPSSAFTGTTALLSSNEIKQEVPDKFASVGVGHSTVHEEMMEADGNADEHEADFSLSTICSPEPPLDVVKKENLLDDIPEESSLLNDSNKENMSPAQSPGDGGLMAKFSRMLASFSPKSAKKAVPIGSDGASPLLKKHLGDMAIKKLRVEAAESAS